MVQWQRINFLDFIAVASKLPETARRSFTLDLQPTNVQLVKNMVDAGIQNNGISEIAMAKNAPGMVGKDEIAQATMIPYGWDTERLTWILSVSSPSVMGSTIVTYLQGYTEYYDPGISGLLDPNMLFYINSATTVEIMQDPVTGQEITKPLSVFNLVYDIAGEGYLEYSHEDTMLMARPEDIVLGIYGKRSQSLINIPTTNAYDENGKAVGSKKLIGTNVATDIINGYLKADGMAEGNMETGMLNSLDIISDTSPMSVPILATIAARYDTNSVSAVHAGVLEELVPGFSLKDIVHSDRIIRGEEGSYLATVQTEVMPSTEHNPTAAIASEIADGAIGAVMDAKLTRVSFIVTNMTADGMVDASLTDVPKTLIPGIDATQLGFKFINVIQHVIFPNVTKGNRMAMSVNATIDIFGVSLITIEMDGYPPYTIPFSSGASNIYSPAVTTQSQFQHMVNAYDYILEGR